MAIRTENPMQSFLRRIPPEARQETLVDELCAELEIALRQREEAVAEVDRLQGEMQRDADLRTAEMQMFIENRDQIIAEIEAARVMNEEELAATREACEAVIRERDELQRQMPAVEEAREERWQALREQKVTGRPSDVAELLEERDAYKLAADKLLEERSDALRDRNDFATQLAEAGERHREEIERLQQQQQPPAAGKKTRSSRSKKAAEEERQRIEALTAERIEALMAERDEALRLHAEISQELSEAREKHASEAEAAGQQLAEAEEKFRVELEGIVAQRDALAVEREEVALQMAEIENERQPALAAAQERDEALEKHRQTAESLAALNTEKERLAAEHAGLAAELERVRRVSAERVDALERERDGLILSRKAMAADLVTLGDEKRGDLEKLSADHDELKNERDRLIGEFAQLRETHEREMEALGDERDRLMQARNETRAYLDTLAGSHRQEIHAQRQELEAVLEERRETLALIERDRLSSRRQIALFTEEREALAGQRDEAISELARERRSLGRQTELRKRECENLAAQRTALLTQLDELRETQKQQADLFEDERRVLAKERDAIGTRLEQALKSLGLDRVALLQEKLEAEARLAAAASAHRKEMEAAQEARDAVLQDRTAVLAELEPIRLWRRRETAAFGVAIAAKYVVPEEGDRSLVQDAALEREVQMKVCPGEEVSESANRQMLAEIRQLGALQHPGIPPVYDAGLNEQGRVYYTTRQIEGRSLGDVLAQLEQGAIHSLLHFTLKRLLGIFHKVCDAMACAHANGVAHGNLRAEHIILGSYGDVAVTGWAFWRSGGRTVTFETALQDDIMALGRLLYEITTLEPPPESGMVRQESSAHKKAVASRERGAQRNPSYYSDADKSLKVLVTVARRALDPRAHDHFHAVRDLQVQVDAFKDSFEDPLRLNLRRLLWRWARFHKITASILLVLFVVAVASLGIEAGQRYAQYRAHPWGARPPIPNLVFPP